ITHISDINTKPHFNDAIYIAILSLKLCFNHITIKFNYDQGRYVTKKENRINKLMLPRESAIAIPLEKPQEE
ncbi:hypothetical protein, partial [Yersinia alsatica]|uniref:hypothetical protein n=1 Tax=Yersinia alsatica TaxID=2890317 RepID=UPI001C98C068